MKVVKWLDNHLEEYLLIALSLFTVIIIFMQVVMRYAFGNSLTWSEEIARYAFIWMIYIGVSYGVKKQGHLGVDALTMLFEKKGKIIVGMIANLSFLIFVVVMTYYGADIMMKVTRTSAALEIPLGYVYAAPAVGFFLTIIRLIQQLTGQVGELKRLKDDSSENSEESYEVTVQEEIV